MKLLCAAWTARGLPRTSVRDGAANGISHVELAIEVVEPGGSVGVWEMQWACQKFISEQQQQQH